MHRILRAVATLLSAVVLTVSGGLATAVLLAPQYGVATMSGAPVADAKAMVHELSNGDAEKGFCSAVAVAPDVALTAAHCTAGRQDGPVFLHKDGKALAVTAWNLPDGRDFAIITVPGLTGPYAERAPVGYLESFANVMVLGYPLGGELTDTYGFFVGWLRIDAPGFREDVLATTAPVKSGNSGGAVFIFVDGKPMLIGILTASLNDNRLSFAVDVTQ